jgi:hypothetical protein
MWFHAQASSSKGAVTEEVLEARLAGVVEHLQKEVLEDFGDQLQQSITKRLERNMHTALDQSLVTIQKLVLSQVHRILLVLLLATTDCVLLAAGGLCYTAVALLAGGLHECGCSQ